jgi:hypothetical protein
MAEQRRENSLLVSLKELRQVEEDRVKEEESAAQAKIDAEARAREDAIRRAKEAEEAKIREAEAKVRREREEKERQIREEQLRLEEAERRARIEAQAKVEEARIAAETKIRVHKATPWRLVAGISAAVFALAAVTIGVIVQKHREEQAEIKRQTDEREAMERKRAEEASERAQKAEAELKKKLDDLSRALTAATSEVDKARIRQQMADEVKHSRRSAKPGKAEGTINTESSDPLGNLPGVN